MRILEWFGFGRGDARRKNKKRKRLPPPKLVKKQTDKFITKMPEAYKLLAGTPDQGFLPVLRNIRALAESEDWDGRRYDEALWHIEFGGYEGSPFTGKDSNAVALVFVAAAYETQMWQLPRVMTVKEIDRLVAYLGPNWPAQKPKAVRQPASITKTVDREYKKSAAFQVENTRVVPPEELEDEPIRKPWELGNDYNRYGGLRQTLMTFRVFVWTAFFVGLAAVATALGVGAFDPLAILAAVWAFIQEYWLEIIIITLLALLLAWLLRKFFKGRRKSKDGQAGNQQSKNGQPAQSQNVEKSEEDDEEDQQQPPEKGKLEVDDVVTLDDKDPEEKPEPEVVKVEKVEAAEESEDADQVVVVEEEEAPEEEPAGPEPEPEKTQAEIDKELREKLRELLKELELEELGKGEKGAIEDAIERAEETISDEDKANEKSDVIRTSTYSHGGVHASVERLSERVRYVDPKYTTEIERRLNKVLSTLDLCGEEASRRLDGKKLTKEMAVKRANLARIRKNELQTGTKLLMVDVSGSCESVAQHALAAAAAILRADNRCVLVVHSNGIPENVYGALEGMLPSPNRCNNGYDVQEWWAEVIRSLNAVANLSGAVNWGDWDAGFIMQQLCESDVPVVWFDHYNNGRVAPACAELRSHAQSWKRQPVAWFQGIRDAETTAIALRLADKKMRDTH